MVNAESMDKQFANNLLDVQRAVADEMRKT